MIDAAAIKTFVERIAEPQIVENSNGREFLIVPEGATVREVSDPNHCGPILPQELTQSLTIQTVESLSAYVLRYREAPTSIFADVSRNEIRAVIDYHRATGEDDSEGNKANFCAHVARLALEFSTEWMTWTGADGRLMSQLDFARFVEENAADIAQPSGADLLEVCRDLQATRKVEFKRAVRTSTDNESFSFSDETTATAGNVEIPTRFSLALPVYFGEGPVRLDAFLRWHLDHLDDGNLKLGVRLHRVEHVRQAAFRSIVETVASVVERPAYYGKLV